MKRNDLLRLTHQSIDNAAPLKYSSKYSEEVQDPESLSEVMTNAIRIATSGKMAQVLLVFRKTLFLHQLNLKLYHLPKTKFRSTE